MEPERKEPGLNQVYEENQARIDALVDPTCLYLLCLLGLKGNVSLDWMKAEYSFKIGTAEGWMGRLVEAGLVDKTEDSGYQLSAIGEAHFAPVRGEIGTGSSSE